MLEASCNNKKTAKVTFKFWKDLFDENSPELFVTVSRTEEVEISWLLHMSPEMQDMILEEYVPETNGTVNVLNSGINVENIDLVDTLDAEDISAFLETNDVSMSPKLKLFYNLLISSLSQLSEE
nr:MAG: hypothetical protein [Enquatrovirus sp.]